MYKKTITYEDYNGNSITEDFYFNLNKGELIEMEASVQGGLSETLKKIVKTNDTPKIMKYFKNLIMKSYGEKSEDGKRFVKNGGELAKQFVETEAYSNLLTELIMDAKFAADFVKGIIPANIAAEMKEAGK